MGFSVDGNLEEDPRQKLSCIFKTGSVRFCPVRRQAYNFVRRDSTNNKIKENSSEVLWIWEDISFESIVVLNSGIVDSGKWSATKHFHYY